MTTIRALMLAQQARHEGWTHPAGGTTCLVCGEEYPCGDRVAADAVLATLDAAELLETWGVQGAIGRFVPDPEASA